MKYYSKLSLLLAFICVSFTTAVYATCANDIANIPPHILHDRVVDNLVRDVLQSKAAAMPRYNYILNSYKNDDLPVDSKLVCKSIAQHGMNDVSVTLISEGLRNSEAISHIKYHHISDLTDGTVKRWYRAMGEGEWNAMTATILQNNGQFQAGKTANDTNIACRTTGYCGFAPDIAYVIQPDLHYIDENHPGVVYNFKVLPDGINNFFTTNNCTDTEDNVYKFENRADSDNPDLKQYSIGLGEGNVGEGAVPRSGNCQPPLSFGSFGYNNATVLNAFNTWLHAAGRNTTMYLASYVVVNGH